MKLQKFFLALTVLCVLLGGCGAQQSISLRAEPTAALNSDPAAETAEALADYAPYGMTYDAQTQILTYNGQRVRYFEDLYPIIWNTPTDGMAGMSFFDEKGTVDVRATRDLSVRRENSDGSYDPSGTLTGLVACSQEEFDARDLSPLKNPATHAATAGEPMTAAELKALYAPYAAYGLTYDAEKDLLYYGGQQVRRFIDIFSTNGQKPASGNFEGRMSSRWDEGGTVDVSAVRDYTKPDDEGCGKLTGVQAATQAEFDAATKDANEPTPRVQFYHVNTTNCVEEG